ncbi:hypothetical protein MJO29_012880 [Puccinia striiformis f. sp. tritici]|nr:hypothetical protein MJO29_012880 [Puccinia striiformis f. sp. tritici]
MTPRIPLVIYLKIRISAHLVNLTAPANSHTHPSKGRLVTVASAQLTCLITSHPLVSRVPSLCTCTNSLPIFSIHLVILSKLYPQLTKTKTASQTALISHHLTILNSPLAQDSQKSGWLVTLFASPSFCPENITAQHATHMHWQHLASPIVMQILSSHRNPSQRQQTQTHCEHLQLTREMSDNPPESASVTQTTPTIACRVNKKKYSLSKHPLSGHGKRKDGADDSLPESSRPELAHGPANSNPDCETTGDEAVNKVADPVVIRCICSITTEDGLAIPCETFENNFKLIPLNFFFACDFYHYHFPEHYFCDGCDPPLERRRRLAEMAPQAQQILRQRLKKEADARSQDQPADENSIAPGYPSPYNQPDAMGRKPTGQSPNSHARGKSKVTSTGYHIKCKVCTSTLLTQPGIINVSDDAQAYGLKKTTALPKNRFKKTTALPKNRFLKDDSGKFDSDEDDMVGSRLDNNHENTAPTGAINVNIFLGGADSDTDSNSEEDN